MMDVMLMLILLVILVPFRHTESYMVAPGKVLAFPNNRHLEV